MPIRRSLWISLASSNGVTLLNFLASLLIARLLSPAQIGLFSIAAVMLGLAGMLREFGVSSYLIHAPILSRSVLGSAQGVAIAIAWLLAMLVWLLTPACAVFFHAPGLTPIMHVLAANLLLVPFGSISFAVLRREMRFGAIARIELGACLAQQATTLIAASHGLGALSLALGMLANSLASVLLVQAYRPAQLPWLPGLQHWREVMRFGLPSSAAALFGYANLAVIDLVIGRMLDSHAVGLFNRALGTSRLLAQVATTALNRVMQPHLAQLARDGDSPQQHYQQAVILATGLAYPFFLTLALLAGPVIRILYGSQWLAAIPLLPVLCLSAALGVPFWSRSQLFLALGRPGPNLSLEIFNLPVKVALVALAVPYGLDAIAWAFCLASLVGASSSAWMLRKHFGMGFGQQLASLRCSLLATALAAIPIGISAALLAQAPDWLRLLGVGACALLGMLAGLILTQHPLGAEVGRAGLALRQRWQGGRHKPSGSPPA